MPTLPMFRPLRMQKLFVVIILLKVACSALAQILADPWLLGFTVPLALMGLYIYLGFRRGNEDVSDEKFGDSCYYLGFIFTISSIAFSLFDVPYLDERGKLTEVAVRFGAAMVSTFLGFTVRAYLAGFRSDGDEAIRALEDRLILALRAFEAKMSLATQSFEALHGTIEQASRDAVSRVQIAMDGVAKAIADGHATAMQQVANEAGATAAAISTELQDASTGMALTLKSTAAQIEDIVRKAGSQLSDAADTFKKRIESSRLPAEMLESTMREPLIGVGTAISRLSTYVDTMRSTVESATDGIESATTSLIRSMSPRGELSDVLARQERAITSLTEQIHRISLVLEGHAQAASTKLERLASELERIRESIFISKPNLLSDIETDIRSLSASHSVLAESQASAIAQLCEVVSSLSVISKNTQQLADDLRASATMRHASSSPITRWFSSR